jgi:hypothetical protein
VSIREGKCNKYYKISIFKALLEEQRREDERKKAKEKERKAAALAGLPKPEAVPQKSILKNKTTTSKTLSPFKTKLCCGLFSY